MIKQRQVWLWGDIDDNLTLSVIKRLSYLANISREDIYLLINSHGGDLDCEAAIIDEITAIQTLGVHVCTLSLGIAYSAAAGILSMGSKGYRWARPHSSIMLHPCSISLEQDYEGNQTILMDFFKNRSECINKKIAQACGMNGKKYKRFLRDIDKGLWLTAQDAVKYGVVDKIYTGPLPSKGLL